jgi:AraC-like DNA-binding protein
MTYADRVRELLLENGAQTRIDMNAVARSLGLSARSLRRRLCDEGISYNTIAEGALATLAKQLLADQARSIQETAYTMGFSDPSAFYRAFKRWTGTTPKTFRLYGSDHGHQPLGAGHQALPPGHQPLGGNHQPMGGSEPSAP